MTKIHVLQIFATSLSPEDKQVLCKLYQSSAILSQLSLSVSNSMDQFIAKQRKSFASCF
jgi:hypothetical protein